MSSSAFTETEIYISAPSSSVIGVTDAAYGIQVMSRRRVHADRPVGAGAVLGRFGAGVVAGVALADGERVRRRLDQ